MAKIKENYFLVFCVILFGGGVSTFTRGSVENYSEQESANKKIKFKTSFITDFNKNADISWLENGELLQPGRYPVEVHVNGKNFKTYDVDFFEESGKFRACIPVEAFKRVSIDHKKMPEGWLKKGCVNPESAMEGATAVYDYDSETLKINIPQVYLLQSAEGFIDPSLWDNGIDALTANYSLSGSNYNGSKNQNYSMYYGNLQTMLRLGAWRFNTFDTLRGGTRERNQVGHLQAYAQRAFPALLSELTLGDFNTSGEFFETTSLRGVILRSDERMLPWTMKGYAPEIRGIAGSNAVVTVRQNNNVLFEQTVSPGEFNISNYNALGFGGDLEVTVTEINGSKKIFHVPYSNLPQLLRKGSLKYSSTIGEVRRSDQVNPPSLLEATAQYGLSNKVTLLGGGQTLIDDSFFALNSGIAVNTFLGAVSTEVIQSFTTGSVKDSGKNDFFDNTKLKVSFANILKETGTNVNFSAYYNPGDNYYSLNDFLSARNAHRRDYETWQPERYRNGFDVTLSQQLLPGWGEVTLNGLWENNNVQEHRSSRSSYLFGYKNSYDYINYSLSVNKTYTDNGREDTRFYAVLSLPFGSRDRSRPALHAAVSYSNNDESRFRTSVNGNHQREDSTMTFSSYFSQSSKAQSDFGINVGHSGGELQKNVSYSQTRNGYAFSGVVSGGILIHKDAIQLSSYLGDTIGVIDAQGAEGASVMGNKQSKIGTNGYGLMPYLSPYEENVINLNTKGAPLGFVTEDDGLAIIPSSGAVVKILFENKNKNKNNIIARVKRASGEFLPFGARIFDENQNVLGTVGQGGIIIVSLPEGYKVLTGKWRVNNKNESCTIMPWSLKNESSYTSLVCEN